MMKWVLVLWVVLVALLAIAAAVGTSLARNVQVVTPFDPIKQEVTGEYGLPDNEPVEVLLLSDAALVEDPAGGPLPLFDRTKSYPVQMKTFWFFFGRLGGSAAVLLLVVTVVVRLLSKPKQAAEHKAT